MCTPRQKPIHLALSTVLGPLKGRCWVRLLPSVTGLEPLSTLRPLSRTKPQLHLVRGMTRATRHIKANKSVNSLWTDRWTRERRRRRWRWQRLYPHLTMWNATQLLPKLNQCEIWGLEGCVHSNTSGVWYLYVNWSIILEGAKPITTNDWSRRLSCITLSCFLLRFCSLCSWIYSRLC